jgi:hypothetical protein
MEKLILLVVAIGFGLAYCYGQDKSQEDIGGNNPKTNIKVNKEYDDQGNLIRYDSTYSYSYSTAGKDSIFNDSIFGSFRDHFNHHFLFSEDPFFKDYFFRDSLMKEDFFDDDYFMKRFQENMRQMDKLFYEMDSVKNDYFKKHMNPKSKQDLKTL